MVSNSGYLVCQLSSDFSQKKKLTAKNIVFNNSPIQDYTHKDDHNPPTYEMTPGFKSFSRN